MAHISELQNLGSWSHTHARALSARYDNVSPICFAGALGAAHAFLPSRDVPHQGKHFWGHQGAKRVVLVLGVLALPLARHVPLLPVRNSPNVKGIRQGDGGRVAQRSRWWDCCLWWRMW